MTTVDTAQVANQETPAQTPQQEARESRLKYVLAIAGPLVLAVGYLWGVVYHAALVQLWGFHSYTPASSTPDVYVQAFWALASVVRRPGAWLTEMPTWLIVVMLVVLLGLGLWWAWLNRSASQSAQPAAVKSAEENLGEPVPWAAMGVVYGVQAIFLVPGVFSVLSIFSALVLAPPYYAAQADAKRYWAQKSFEGWDQATWTTDTGEKRAGLVHSCSSDECALLDADGFAMVVPRERVGMRTNRSRLAVSGGKPAD